MIKYLKTAYLDSPAFVFHKPCHQDFMAYCNAIHKQNSFLANCQVIPLTGILESTMFYLEHYLYQLEGVFNILEHKCTASEGRYSILTITNTFSSNASTIKEHLEKWVTDITNEQSLNTHHSFIPKVCFKGNQVEEESNSNQSYLSACSTMFTEFSIDEAPSTPGPATQAWSALLSIPGTIEATTSTGVSTLSHDEFDHVTNENSWLSKELTALKQQMATLLKTKQMTNTSSNLLDEPTSNPPQSTTQLQKSIITPNLLLRCTSHAVYTATYSL